MSFTIKHHNKENEMRTYDCQHHSIDGLEKELLFKEVMRLRNLICDAEGLLEEIVEIGEINDETNDKIRGFLGHKK